MTDLLDERAAISCEEITPPGARLYRLGDLLGEIERDAEEAHQAYMGGHARGAVSGFASLDEQLGGAFFPGLHVIHGGPGTGKTALALQIAATCGTPALFVSCEISPLEIMRRLMARTSGIYLQRFKSGELEPAEVRARAHVAGEKSPLLALADGTAGFPDSDWLQRQASLVRGDERHLLIVVDSLHTWASRAPWGARSTEYDGLNTALGALEQLAGALAAPVLVISERNRTGMESGGMSAAKGTSRIEYAGESVIGMNTETDRDTRRPIPFDANGERPVKLWIEKNRHGEGGRAVSLLFHGALQRFRED